MSTKKMDVEISNFHQLLCLANQRDFIPDPPEPDQKIMTIQSLDRKMITKLVKIDDTTYRFVGIEDA